MQSRQGDIKNSIGNGEAKELICTTHGYELGMLGERTARGGCGLRRRGRKGRKKLGQL